MTLNCKNRRAAFGSKRARVPESLFTSVVRLYMEYCIHVEKLILHLKDGKELRNYEILEMFEVMWGASPGKKY